MAAEDSQQPIRFSSAIVALLLSTVGFWLAQYSTTPPYANANTCLIPVNPLGCTVHDKCCTAQPQGHTQTGIPFEYAPHVYWKTGAYENVTPQFEQSPSIFFWVINNWESNEKN